MKLLLLIVILTTSTTAITIDERCLELGEKNIVLTCPPCPEPDVSTGVKWCIQGDNFGTPPNCIRVRDCIYCDNFRPYFNLDVKTNGDLLMDVVRNVYDQTTFSCIRSCNRSENIMKETNVSVSSALQIAISKVSSNNHVMWHESETERFLCFGGLSGGNTTFSWLYEVDDDPMIQGSGQKLPDIVDISEYVTDCNIVLGCAQTCLSSVIKSLATNTTLPHPYVLKRPACGAASNSVKDGDYFRYVLLLVFGEVSTEYGGKHQFIISRHDGRSTGVDVVSTNVTVSPAIVRQDIKLQNVLSSYVTLREQENYVIVCEVTGRSDVNANTSWVRNSGIIRQLPNISSGLACDTPNSDVFYTVESSMVRTTDYPNNTFNNSVFASSFTVTLYFCNITTTMMDKYSCEAYNSSKPLQVLVVVKDEDSEEEDKLEVALIIGFIVLNSVLVVAIAMALVVLFWIRHSNKKQSNHQLMSQNAGLPVYLHGSRQIETSFFQDSDLKSDPLEFPFDQLEMLHPLGEGNFGCVYKARANGIIPGDNVRNIVAVKTLKGNARPSDIDDLEQELLILKMIQPHCNILNLLGYCNKPGVPLCLIVEFAFHGSLKEFLKLCRQHSDKQPVDAKHTPVHSGYLNDTSYYNDSSMAQPMVTQQVSLLVAHYVNGNDDWYMYQRSVVNTSDYYNTSTSQLQKDYHTKLGRLSVADIYFFMLQIARGMEHIGKMKLVHRDLAARNVLIAEGFVLKIGDFGLSRNLTDKDYYRKTGRGMIPARWMALESLDSGVHTYQSDVWSYGVVIWEILTYADLPYGMENFTKSIKGIIEYLKSGNRLTPPAIYGSIFYPMMSQCWEVDPNERPSFSELAESCEVQLLKLTSSV